MENVDIKVCVRPYAHDVIDEINRKPIFRKSTNKHVVRYKGAMYELSLTGVGYVVWVDDE